MGLFDAFDAGDESRLLNKGYKRFKNDLGEGRDQARDLYGRGEDFIKDFHDDALGYVDRGYNTGRIDLRQGIDDALGRVDAGIGRSEELYDQGLGFLNDADAGFGYLGAGADRAEGAIEEGITPWRGLYDRGTEGIDYYGLLSGLQGGQAGQDAFEDSVDYRVSRAAAEAGLGGLSRFANARGMLESGNMSQDAMDYMARHDAETLANARNALNPYFGLAQSGAAGIQAGKNKIGDVRSQLGRDQASFLQNQGQLKSGFARDMMGIRQGYDQLGAGISERGGQSLADLAKWRGGLKGGFAADAGGRLAGLNQGLANAILGSYSQQGQGGLDTGVNLANANSAAEKSMWDAILGLGNAAAKAYAGGGTA